MCRLGGCGARSHHGESFGAAAFRAVYLKSLSKCAEGLGLSPTPAALWPRPQSKPVTSQGGLYDQRWRRKNPDPGLQMVQKRVAQGSSWGPKRAEAKENPLREHDFKPRVWPLPTSPGLKDGQKDGSRLIRGRLLMAWLDHQSLRKKPHCKIGNEAIWG